MAHLAVVQEVDGRTPLAAELVKADNKAVRRKHKAARGSHGCGSEQKVGSGESGKKSPRYSAPLLAAFR